MVQKLLAQAGEAEFYCFKGLRLVVFKSGILHGIKTKQ